MTLTVLSDDQVSALLESLTVQELEDFRLTLASSLHEYSGGSSDTHEDLFQQPHRSRTTHLESKRTTQYVPLCAPEGMACKVVSTSSKKHTEKSEESADVQPASGALTLFSPEGHPLAFIASPTLTSFRTALTSSCLLYKRIHVKDITVFGAGSQAYWHVRLALMLRGSTIRHVNIINHRFSSAATSILKKFTMIPQAVKEREGWGSTKFTIMTPSFHEFDRLVKVYVREADVIYCCTSSQSEDGLFDASYLTSHEGRKKGRLICAVGDGRELPEELVKLVTKQHGTGHHRHYHKHADEGGVMVVDTLHGALRDASEIKAAEVDAKQLVELGELVMLHRQRLEESENSSVHTADSQVSSETDPSSFTPSSHTPSMSTVYSSEPRTSSRSSSRSPSRKSTFSIPFRRNSSHDDLKPKNSDDRLLSWLRDGTVVYRSVGLGVTDLVVGMKLVKIANEKGVGTQIPGF